MASRDASAATGREFAIVGREDQPLDEFELTTLGAYNAEVHHGLIHTKEWRARMAILQERFDAFGFVMPSRKRWWQRRRYGWLS